MGGDMPGIPSGDGAPAIELDPSTAVGMVRLLAADNDPDRALFTDAQIQALLAAEGGNAKRAAAAVLTAISVSHVLIARKFSTQDLSVDGPAVAAELRASAKALRDQAAAEEVQEEEVASLEIAPYWRFPAADPLWDCPTYF